MVKKILNPLLLFFILVGVKGVSQCPVFFDGTGALSSSPSWVNCGNGAYTLNLSSNSSFGSYVVDWGDGSSPDNGSSYTASSIISHDYSTVNDSFTVTITISSPACTITGKVYRKDLLSVSVDGQIKCTPFPSFTFSNVSDYYYPSAQRYEKWNFHDNWSLGHDSITGWLPWPPASSQTITFLTTGPHIVTFVDSTVCGLDSINKSIIVVAAPVAGIAAPVDTACAGSTLTFNNSSNSGATYKWNFGENGTWTAFPMGNVTHVFNNAGTFTVSVAAITNGSNSSCKDTASLSVTILPLPVSSFALSSNTGCDTLSVSFTNNSSASAVIWNWKNNGVSFSSSQIPASQSYTVGTYSIALVVTDTSGCSKSSQHVINVYESPEPSFTNGVICQDVNVSFTDNSVSPAGDPVTSWLWDFGDGSPASNSQNPSHTYTSAGVFTVSLNVSTAHCSKTTTIATTVNAKPTSSFTASSASGCGPLNVDFTNTSVGALNYNWDFGNTLTSTSTNPSSLYTNATATSATFTTNLIAASSAGCTDTTAATITVFGKPQAAFNAGTSSGCTPLSVNFSNNSNGATSYAWDFGDGSAISTTVNPNHIFQNSTSVTISYTVSLIAQNVNGCSDTTTQVIEVLPKTNYPITASSDSGCGPLTVNFTSVAGAVNYNWDFGDGSSSVNPNPSHAFLNTSLSQVVFIVQLTASNSFGCINSTALPITIFGKPNANFTANPSAGCPVLPVNFTNSSAGFSSSSWNFGDGSVTDTTTSPSHYFSNGSSTSPVTYTTSLIVLNTDGCSDTITGVITVDANVVAALVPDTPACAGTSLSFTNNSSGSDAYSWNFGDGGTSTLTSPSHIYANSGAGITTYTVTLIAKKNSSGCADTSTAVVNIYPVPPVSFTANPASQLFPSATVTLNNTTANIGLWNYAWNFGDSTTSNVQQPGSTTYATWGNYTISLIGSSPFCSDTATQNITIIPPVPVAGFTGSFTGCKPLTVSFINTSVYATSYSWKFGDGGTSTQANPTYTYTSSGSFNVELTATGPGGTNIIVGFDSVVVLENPVANFTANPTVVYIPTTILKTTNLSANSTTYFWDFGDGDTSALFSPTHIYTTEGNYQITLIAENNAGCSDTFLLPVLIKAETQEDVFVPNAFSPNPNTPSADGSYDPDASDNDIFHPLLAGAKKFEMRIYNRWGELVFMSEDVNKGWDGYYKGKLCTQDIYIWKIVAETYDDKKIDKAGDLLLIR